MARSVPTVAVGGMLVSVLTAGIGVGSAHAGVIELDFQIDAYGMTGDGQSTQMGSGDFGVVDLWATTNASNVKLLNVFSVQLSLARGSFVHNDAHETGKWSAAYSGVSGANSSIDSFVTIGPAQAGGDPFVALLDPGFDDSESGSIASGAGWFNPDPFNDQGLFQDSATRIFLGRFVFDQADVAGNTFRFSGSLGWKLDEAGSTVRQSSGMLSRSFPGEVVPGPVAGSILGALMLLRRRRR